MKKVYSFPRGGIFFEDSGVPSISRIRGSFSLKDSILFELIQTFLNKVDKYFVWKSARKALAVVIKGKNILRSRVSPPSLPAQAQSKPERTTHTEAFLPLLSVIPLVQNNGARLTPLVEVGDIVREGMLVARAESVGAANIHATVPGTIVRTVSWEMAEGIMNEGLIIRMGGSFEKSGRPELIFSWQDRPASELLKRVDDCGIVEMEGSGRPIREVLADFMGTNKPGTLVLSCVFDDPWRVADYVLCQERFADVLEGSAILGKMSGVNRIIYAVSWRERRLAARLMQEATKYDIPATAVLVGSRYPQSNARELELALRVYERKEGEQLGRLIIEGPATLTAIRDAVVLKKPILERFVAVGGSAVRHPQVMRTRIGKRIREMFNECGGFIRTPSRIASGSPLSGYKVADLDEPVTKNMYALFAILPKHDGGRTTRSCIGCGECRAVCPVGLDPEALFKHINLKLGGIGRATECHGCGCCDVVCPSRLPLSTEIINATVQERKYVQKNA
jgi:electron transport complex protein RnfC